MMAANTTPAGRSPSRDHLEWPFFGAEQRALARDLDGFIAGNGLGAIDHGNADAACKDLVKRLAAKEPEAGVPAALHGKRRAR